METLVPELQHLVRIGEFPADFALYLAQARLDANRQRLVLRQYRDHPRPTWTWFKGVVAEQLRHTQGTLGFMHPLFDLKSE
ncbi:MAG TPA: hypothetical protein PKH77_05080 [Anaerolineae bacterium]|nr:hypothetical protein [Anaerolineae bacterium]